MSVNSVSSVNPVSSQAPPPAKPAVTQVAASKIHNRADSDGDGRTGAAALNDGDAAARAVAQQTKSTGRMVDVKA